MRSAAALKIIHGYGSTGVGGAQRKAVRKSLALRRKEGLVRAFAFGERCGPRDPMSRELARFFPELYAELMLARPNPGVTIVALELRGERRHFPLGP